MQLYKIDETMYVKQKKQEMNGKCLLVISLN